MEVDGMQQQRQQQQTAPNPAAAAVTPSQQQQPPPQQQRQDVPSTSSKPQSQQQQQQQQQDAATAETHAEPSAETEAEAEAEPEEAEHTDPHGLQDPKRPYNPLAGCRVCWREDDKAKLLLCDGCNDEYHCYCVTPALLDVPEGDWYCPVCSSSNEAGAAAAAAAAKTPAAGDSSWDLAAAAQLPQVAGSGSSSSDVAAWSRPGMQYIRELVGTAQRLGSVAYGSWPVAARLDLLVLLCEMLAASNTGALV
jgi:hypothetical protein